MVSRVFVLLQIVFELVVVIRAVPLYGLGHDHDHHPPRHDSAVHATYRKRLYARGMELEFYHPKSSFKRYSKNNSTSDTNKGSHGFLSQCSSSMQGHDNNWRLNESAMAFVSQELGVEAGDLGYHKGWSGSNGKFAFVKQYIGGIPVANAIANVAYDDKDLRVFSFGSSFIDTKNATIAPSKPTLDFQTLVPRVESLFNGQLFTTPRDEQQPQQPKLEYVARPDGSVSLTYPMQIRNLAASSEDYLWVQANVCAHSGKVVSVTDFTAHATYNVVPIHKQNFFDGRELVVDPEDFEVSPKGWVITDPDPTRGLATGNNVVVLVNGTSSTLDNQPLSKAINNPNGTFDNPYDPDSPLDLGNLNATIDNVFYVMNSMHDFAYRYGFTENAGNFQVDNFGKGVGSDGGAGDPVGVSIHDFTGVDNAVFSSPPDGIPGSARFFFFELAKTSTRDSAFANDVLIHEYTHGITNRMTGGGTGGCLQTLESGGMGEGWSDMMAAWMGQTSEKVEDFRVGTYFVDSGLRTHPYSTDATVNPLKYSDVSRLMEVHNIGEVWANTLYNVYADLVSRNGFEPNAVKETDSSKGNVVFMHNFMDGLLLQPCNPTMVDARDAILAADHNRYQGEHECTMWGAFARKGLGVGAGDFVDDFSVPVGC